MARLATGLWVQAYLTRLRLTGIAVYVVAKGDPTAGAVMVKLATMDGEAAVFQRVYDFARDETAWTEMERGPEPQIDASLARQSGHDRDLWVIEVEDRQGRTLLDEPGLS